jgi:hypothetical protein
MGSFAAFDMGWIADLILPAAVFIFGYSAVTVQLRRSSDKARKELKAAFARYVSPDVVDQIIRDPGRLKLGGQGHGEHVDDFRRVGTDDLGAQDPPAGLFRNNLEEPVALVGGQGLGRTFEEKSLGLGFHPPGLGRVGPVPHAGDLRPGVQAPGHPFVAVGPGFSEGVVHGDFALGRGRVGQERQPVQVAHRVDGGVGGF